MGNSLHSSGDREKGKSSKSLTNYGHENVEKSGGCRGGVEADKGTEVSTEGATNSASNNVVHKKNKEKEEKKGKKSSSKVVLENQTDKVLVLREKVGAAYGKVRYQIEAGKFIAIEVGLHSTYYRMLVYAVEVEDKKTEDTGLTIDTDILSDAKHIVISKGKDDKYIFS